MRKHIYKWHRTLSLIIALPVVLWALSGFMHPVMTNIRPAVAQQWYAAPPIDSNRIIVSLKEALGRNNIPAINNFRIVSINGNLFYQVKLPGQTVLKYISTQSGGLLQNGDELYARYLAKIFLEGSLKEAAGNNTMANENTIDAIAVNDCCINAANSVMNNSKGAKITSATFLEKFDGEYKSINRLLPVYKVNFDRGDGIRIYVHTGQDQFGFGVDNKRAVFDKLFMLFHTMSWMDGLGNGRLVIEISIMLIAFTTTLMGIWIFFTTKGKKVAGNKLVKARWNHRYTSIIASIFTLLFTFSGAFHAFEKFTPDTRDQFFVENNFDSSQINLEWKKLVDAIHSPDAITNVSLVKIANKNYWQVYHKNSKAKPVAPKKQGGDFVKAMTVPVPNTFYVNTDDYSLLPDGENVYARFLATQFSKHNADAIRQVSAITKFEGEYGFVNKRLPVWKVDYNSNQHERYYVETASGKLSVRIDDADLYEGNSFSFLHKHHFMDFAGKSWRDFSTMFWAAMQVAMVVVGLLLWRRARKNRAGIKPGLKEFQ